MSLVEVLPVEPVIATTRAPSSQVARHARAPAGATSGIGVREHHAGLDPASPGSSPRQARRRARAPPALPRRRRRAPARHRCRRRRARRADRRTGRPAATARESIVTRARARRRRGRPPACGSQLAPPARVRRSRAARPNRSRGGPCRRARRAREGFAGDGRRRRTAPCARRRTPVPARGPCRRSPPRRRVRAARWPGSIAARRSTSMRTRRRHRTRRRARAAPCRPGSRAMIASGSSERGLSEVTITTSARRAAISPISGPLAAVAVAAGAEDADDARRGADQLARGAQHVLERVGRVGVVDEHGEVLTLLDGLEAAGHAHARARAPRPACRARPRARARRRARRARWRR